jgi:terminal uridylyltransferase
LKLKQDRPCNKQTCAELWLELLRYYTEEFDFDKNVVSICRDSLLSRKEKVWFTESIAIEDPFDINHNLGAGLSRRSKLPFGVDFQVLSVN